jgi:hypothetical protein
MGCLIALIIPLVKHSRTGIGVQNSCLIFLVIGNKMLEQ